jgi:hypothetical protein
MDQRKLISEEPELFSDPESTTLKCKFCSYRPDDSRYAKYNFARHIESQHKSDLQKIMESKLEHLVDEVKENKNVTLTILGSEDKTIKRQKMGLGTLCSLVLKTYLPMNVLFDPDMRKIWSAMSNFSTIPSKPTINRYLDERLRDYNCKLQTTFATSKWISIACDLWKTGDQRVVLLMFARVCTKDNQHINYIVDLIKLTEQKAAAISNGLVSLCGIYAIPPERIIGFTSDNCNTMIKTAKDFKIRLETIITLDIEKEEEELENQQLLETSESEEDLETIFPVVRAGDKIDNKIKNGSFGDGQKDIFRYGCINHYLHLAVLNSIKEVPSILKFIENSISLTKFLRVETISNKIKIRIPMPITIRWLSIYQMIEKIIQHETKIRELANNEDPKYILIREFDFEKARSLDLILKKLSEIVLKMERDEPEIGYFYNWFREFKEIQLKIQELPLQWKCLSKFIDKLITNIEKKVYCVKEYKQHILISTFLDRQHITGMGNEDREQAKSLILTNFSHFYKPMPENNTQTDNPDNPANLSDSQLLD